MKKLSLGVYLNTGIALMLMTASVFLIVYINTFERKHALIEAQEKAKIILNRNMATHTYFSRNLKPPLFDLIDTSQNESYFEPSWMSSTYAVREIDNYFQSLTDDKYYYKECAINARSPENEADEFEKAFIEDLNSNPELEFRSLIRELEDGVYFVTLRRGEVLEEGCMRCHSTPDNAPKGLTETYGTTRSFNRTVGDVISAISIRVPISESYARADRRSINLSFVFIITLLAIFIVQYFINKFFVHAPIQKMREKALQVAEDDQRLGEEILLPASRELSDLAQSFNYTSKKLRENMDSLEGKIHARTMELEKTNEHLKEKMDEVLETTKEKLALENRLRHAKKMESIGTMAGGIVHSFNNILGVVLGYADMAKDEIPKNSIASKYIDKVLVSGNRAKYLVQQINAFSQQKDSRQRKTQADLVLHEALWLINDLIPEAIQKENNISSNLALINIDQKLFEKVVINLCKNALDSMHGAKGTLGVSLKSSTLKQKDILGELGVSPGDFVKLTISDTGHGVSAENLERIFDPFFTTKEVGQGDGIGLSVVHGIVQKSGGVIKVETEVGKGTKVHVYLPVAEML